MTKYKPNIWVLIPAARQHLTHVLECISVMGMPKHRILIVANGEHPLTEHETKTRVLYDRNRDINISRWWNLGLDRIEALESDEDDFVAPHHVLVLNADARIGPNGIAKLSFFLDVNPEIHMVGPMRGVGRHKETRPEPLGLEQRIPGYCFMLTSNNRMRADEQFRWWCGDDDLMWRAAESGGTLRVGRLMFGHLGDGMPRGKLMKLANEDLIRFEAKWGIRPW